MTVIIFLLITLFFMLLQFEASTANYTLGDEDYPNPVDANRIGVLYVQAPIETPQGMMTFGSALPLALEDADFMQEYKMKTQEFFDHLCFSAAWGIGPQITITKEIADTGEEEEVLQYWSCISQATISAAYTSYQLPHGTTDVIIPLPHAGETARIAILLPEQRFS